MKILPKCYAWLTMCLCVSAICVFPVIASAQPQPLPAGIGATQNIQSVPFVWEDYKDPSQPHQSRSVLAILFDFVWKTLLVVGLLYLTIRLLKLIYTNRATLGDAGSVFNIMDTYYLKPNQALYLVEMLGRYQVLGVTAQSITPICEITDPQQIAALKDKKQNAFNFKANLAGMMSGKTLTMEDRLAVGSQKILEQINKISGRTGDKV